jgi:hypothetical protein
VSKKAWMENSEDKGTSIAAYKRSVLPSNITYDEVSI